jgi:hypothetical protein
VPILQPERLNFYGKFSKIYLYININFVLS